MRPVTYLEKANTMAKRIKTAAEAQLCYDSPIINWNWYISELANYILKMIKNKK